MKDIQVYDGGGEPAELIELFASRAEFSWPNCLTIDFGFTGHADAAMDKLREHLGPVRLVVYEVGHGRRKPLFDMVCRIESAVDADDPVWLRVHAFVGKP